MRFTIRDGIATVFVAAAAGLYTLWVTGTAATGLSTRLVGVVVLTLGFVGCTSAGPQMASAYGTAGASKRPSGAYGVVASLAGIGALVSGVIVLVSGSSIALAVLVGATVLLWMAATVRHAASPSALRHP